MAGHIERQPMRSLPRGNRFNECTGRELAVAHGADTTADDPGAQGIREARPEVPRRRAEIFLERYDEGPDLLG